MFQDTVDFQEHSDLHVFLNGNKVGTTKSLHRAGCLTKQRFTLLIFQRDNDPGHTTTMWGWVRDDSLSDPAIDLFTLVGRFENK